jgi:2-polyprenyl-3-methyl-5-hydroxy-6-metoxy-1,4-benzoquinol methylase
MMRLPLRNDQSELAPTMGEEINRLFQEYDKVDKVYREWRAKICLEYCRGGTLILDLGAGKGELSILLYKSGYDVISLDIDKSVLIEAKKKGFQGEAILGDGTQLPFRNDLFDRVVCVEVVEHVRNPWRLIEEVRRISKSRALFILTTPNGQRLIKSLAKVIKIQLKISQSHVCEFLPKNLFEMFQASKFKILKVLKLALEIPTPLLYFLPSSFLHILLKPMQRLPLVFFKFIIVVAQK